MTSEVLHNNEHYSVVACRNVERGYGIRYNGSHYYSFYEVVNNATGIAEYRTPNLAEAISASESFDVALAQKMWKWIRDEHPVVNPDGSEVH